MVDSFYKAFHRFKKLSLVIFGYGGFVSDPGQFLLLPSVAALKNKIRFKSGKLLLENNHIALPV